MRYILKILFLFLFFSNANASCSNNITYTAPNSRYQLINNNNEVKDLKTNLIWQRCSLGQTLVGNACVGVANKYSWYSAIQLKENIHEGWYLPNIKELQSLVEAACYEPSINQMIFPNIMSSNYWSSSPVAGNPNKVWVVDFRLGAVVSYTGYKYDNLYVRLVRSSQ